MPMYIISSIDGEGSPVSIDELSQGVGTDFSDDTPIPVFEDKDEASEIVGYVDPFTGEFTSSPDHTFYRVTVEEGGWHDCEESLGPDWQRLYETKEEAQEAASNAEHEAEQLVIDGDKRFAGFRAGITAV